jgi:D-alanyl-D-alanine-carboxypeptidase/D-alanyl-D-alanine-endopeptidase
MKIVKPTNEQIQELVNPYIQNQDNGLGFAIGCASPQFPNNGQIFYAGSIRNQYQEPVPLTPDTYFEIASITKTFTAALYAYLIQFYHNKEATVGEFAGPGKAIQIGSQFSPIPLETLASYTSGLPEDNLTARDIPPYLPIPYSVAGMLGFLKMTPLKPNGTGEQYTYSNLAFALLAEILPCLEASGSTFSELLAKAILKPLGMSRTMFFGDVRLDQLPMGYLSRADNFYVPISPGWEMFDAYYGAAGLVSTPKEIMIWLLFNMGIIKSQSLTPLLSVLQKSYKNVTDSDGNGLGLGWFIQKDNNNAPKYLCKDGELDGFNSYIAFLPSATPGSQSSQIGVFVLTNASAFSDPRGTEVVVSIANDLLLIMQGQEPPKDKSLYGRASFSRIAGAKLDS